MDRDAGWTPRDLGGGVFCSPLCGCRCTRAEHDYAVAQSAKLAATLGEGWEPQVWENGGWNYAAIKGVARVTVCKETPYRFEAGIRLIAGYMGWVNSSVCGQTITDMCSDPVEAIGVAMQEARTKLLRFQAELDFISNESTTQGEKTNG